MKQIKIITNCFLKAILLRLKWGNTMERWPVFGRVVSVVSMGLCAGVV